MYIVFYIEHEMPLPEKKKFLIQMKFIRWFYNFGQYCIFLLLCTIMSLYAYFTSFCFFMLDERVKKHHEDIDDVSFCNNNNR